MISPLGNHALVIDISIEKEVEHTEIGTQYKVPECFAIQEMLTFDGAADYSKPIITEKKYKKKKA
jgi:hypothetical protein